jgi:glycosyltransferase involved in cell wall biosynthesis
VRILLATSQRALVGGVEKYLQHIIPALAGRGHSLGLVFEYPCDASADRIDSEEAQIPGWCAASLGVESVMDSIARWAPDVVYSHGVDDGALEAALLEKYPAILFAHTYYGTCVSGRKCHAQPHIQPCARKLGAPCLLNYYPRRCGGLNPATMFRLYREQTARNRRLREYRAILVASQHMKLEYSSNGASAGQVRVLRLPSTDTAPAATSPRRELASGRILFLGRLVDVKGAGHLIRAIPAAAEKLGRRLALTIAGEGPQRRLLTELASRLNVQVDFAGWVDNGRRLELIRQADLLAIPSLWPEPFGLVGIEAGRQGVPAVGYAVGGIPDWLLAGETGELAPGDPPSVNGLTAAIVRALADPIHYSRLSRGAWELAQKFALEAHLDQLESILAAERPLELALQ